MRQRNAVSEGAALGVVLCGKYSLPADESALDSAFTAAWRRWPYAHAFPQVGIDIRNGKNGYLVLTRADAAKQTSNFYWHVDGDELTICPRPQWRHSQLDESIAASEIEGDIPVRGWYDLGNGLLQRLEDWSSLGPTVE
ncbi:hypothetical protein CH254_04535 [Rhodococcus sp. 06-412-2C]|nr:hypothetical protein CH254_04535 [Rhodococcus sp. 06-412-2C]OZC92319.1 hypothetical protein CH279_25810 [Rhodococcus sp. 06-412-2B]